MHTRSVVAASLLGLIGVQAQSCPASCQSVIDFSNNCANSIPVSTNAASTGWGGWPAFGSWSGSWPGSGTGSWSGSNVGSGFGSWLPFGGLGGGWKKRSVNANSVGVAANVMNAWSTTAGINCMCANTAIYNDASSCISSCTDVGTLFYSRMVNSNCNAAGQPLNANGPIIGWKKRRSVEPALNKRQMGGSWTGGGSPSDWLGGTTSGTTGGATGGSTGGTGHSGSAPANVAPAAAAPATAPTIGVIPASPASGPSPQGQAPGGNQLLFAGAPKLSHGLAYVLAAGLATSVALLI